MSAPTLVGVSQASGVLPSVYTSPAETVDVPLPAGLEDWDVVVYSVGSGCYPLQAFRPIVSDARIWDSNTYGGVLRLTPGMARTPLHFILNYADWDPGDMSVQWSIIMAAYRWNPPMPQWYMKDTAPPNVALPDGACGTARLFYASTTPAYAPDVASLVAEADWDRVQGVAYITSPINWAQRDGGPGDGPATSPEFEIACDYGGLLNAVEAYSQGGWAWDLPYYLEWHRRLWKWKHGISMEPFEVAGRHAHTITAQVSGESGGYGNIGTLFAFIGTAGPKQFWCLHSRLGQFHAAHVNAGQLVYRRADYAQPPFVVDTTVRTGTRPRMAEDADMRLHMVYEAGGSSYLSVSDDDGETWGAGVAEFTGGTYPTLAVQPLSGALVTAVIVSGAIKGRWRAQPNETPEAFSFLSDTGAAMLTADAFHFTPAPDGRWLLVVRITGESDVSYWESGDDCRTWSRIT